MAEFEREYQEKSLEGQAPPASVAGALICLLGVAVIMYAPRA
jgi:drug/metabolite transporter superfamily protein YnfA